MALAVRKCGIAPAPTGPGWSPRSARPSLTRAPISCRWISIPRNRLAGCSCSAPSFICRAGPPPARWSATSPNRSAPRGMDYLRTEAAKPKRVAIMASTEDHCLLDLMWRNHRGELDMSVVMVIANHPDLADGYARSPCPSSSCRHARRFGTKPNGASSTCCEEESIWWC